MQWRDEDTTVEPFELRSCEDTSGHQERAVNLSLQYMQLSFCSMYNRVWPQFRVQDPEQSSGLGGPLPSQPPRRIRKNVDRRIHRKLYQLKHLRFYSIGDDDAVYEATTPQARCKMQKGGEVDTGKRKTANTASSYEQRVVYEMKVLSAQLE